jgi:large subunit ribosomal protein L21
MFAVVATGGKQYKVKPGQLLKVESLDGEVGSSVDFTNVLLVGADDGTVKTGHPYLVGSRVCGTIRAQGHAPKVVTVKLRRRKNSRRKAGHRQPFSEVEISSIEIP